MLDDAKTVTKFEGFTSISELIRHALRQILYPNGLTVNGFTPEFEDMVLESAKEPIDESTAWNSMADIDRDFKRLKLKNKKL